MMKEKTGPVHTNYNFLLHSGYIYACKTDMYDENLSKLMDTQKKL